MATTALRMTSAVKASTLFTRRLQWFFYHGLNDLNFLNDLKGLVQAVPVVQYVQNTGFSHWVPPNVITRCPKALTVTVSPGSTTVVEATSSMMAGPSITLPCSNFVRSNTVAS